MVFYTLKIEIAEDGAETRDLRHFDTVADALVRFHSDLAKYIGNTGSILEMVINEKGEIVEKYRWEKEVVESTSEDVITKTEEVSE